MMDYHDSYDAMDAVLDGMVSIIRKNKKKLFEEIEKEFLNEILGQSGRELIKQFSKLEDEAQDGFALALLELIAYMIAKNKLHLKGFRAYQNPEFATWEETPGVEETLLADMEFKPTKFDGEWISFREAADSPETYVCVSLSPY